MSLFFREKRQWTGEPIIPPYPGAPTLGASPRPSMSQAMQVSAVWACVRLIADTVSMMPVQTFTLKAGQRTPIAPPPFFVRPNADNSMSEWVYMAVVSLMLRGNAFGHITGRDAQAYPTQIDWWNPDQVTLRANRDTGILEYAVNGTAFPRADVFHIRAYPMPGSALGLSPVQYAAMQIQTEGAIKEFAYGFFRDGAHPSSILTTDQTVDKDGARTIKDRLNAAIQGREPLVIGAGLKYQQIQVSPEESQFLATQKYGVAEICRVFGVPPEMVAAEAGNSMTYANVEQRGIDFLTYSIQPWLTRLETAMSPLLPGAKHARFDTSVLLRTDLETRVKSGAIAIASKQMTVDEVRAWNDLAPLTPKQKADLELVPLTVSPTGMPKDAPAGLAPGQAPAQDAPTEGAA